MFRSVTQRCAARSKAAKRFFVDDSAFGQHVFKGAVADKYLKKQGLSASVLDSPSWTSDGSANKVAAAVLEWARDNNASVCTHWFQPLAAAGVREGQTGQVVNSIFSPFRSKYFRYTTGCSISVQMGQPSGSWKGRQC